MPETAEEKRKRILTLAKEAVGKAYSTGEHALAQAVNAYNETEKSRNLLHERLEEWYGIYFPELETGSPETYARFVIEAGKDKKQASMETLEKVSKEKAAEIHALIQRSIGNEPNPAEYEAIKALAVKELELISLEKELDAFMKENVPKAMPNICYLIEYRLAAELLAKAGSLQKLSVMPASTLQLLGAEKALFRHLRSGSRSPKYGILFRLKEVTMADRWNKGKVARVFATKLSIAARADAITKRFIGEELKASLDKSLERIKSAPIKPHVERPENERGFRQGGRPRQGRPAFKREAPFRPSNRPALKPNYGRPSEMPGEGREEQPREERYDSRRKGPYNRRPSERQESSTMAAPRPYARPERRDEDRDQSSRRYGERPDNYGSERRDERPHVGRYGNRSEGRPQYGRPTHRYESRPDTGFRSRRPDSRYARPQESRYGDKPNPFGGRPVGRFGGRPESKYGEGRGDRYGSRPDRGPRERPDFRAKKRGKRSDRS
ncbi:putative NOP5 family protein [uncultured archaeon]|nr:putative NOP5 family protein [uncultured archaeon]